MMLRNRKSIALQIFDLEVRAEIERGKERARDRARACACWPANPPRVWKLSATIWQPMFQKS